VVLTWGCWLEVVIYLNEVQKGGETEIQGHTKVAPRRGCRGGAGGGGGGQVGGVAESHAGVTALP
jgi:hypothetical protein